MAYPLPFITIIIIYVAITYITAFITSIFLVKDLAKNKHSMTKTQKKMYLFTYSMFLGFAPLFIPLAIYKYISNNNNK